MQSLDSRWTHQAFCPGVVNAVSTQRALPRSGSQKNADVHPAWHFSGLRNGQPAFGTADLAMEPNSFASQLCIGGENQYERANWEEDGSEYETLIHAVVVGDICAPDSVYTATPNSFAIWGRKYRVIDLDAPCHQPTNFKPNTPPAAFTLDASRVASRLTFTGAASEDFALDASRVLFHTKVRGR